ncbi:Putative ATPase, nucleotide binding domain-containing protein [Septoria linicola]|uniref:ATPase, nucleotide binding domain-containing protein n=1 Tax=Septoria linicola TaxID=215465 RepID=A0A9Q9EP82_9PEZI|nr:putative ATPase, nucleotide binding domain-containing protein [Septoria linicola]USW58531.1 Putative ATPase, nucleotide binding domain-containing protein [Septoria linicola]
MEGDRLEPRRVVYISIDFGTTKIAAAYWIGEHGTQPLDVEISDVKFGNHPSSPQKVAFIDGKCYQGYKLEQMLRDGEVKQEQVIEYLKVLFYKNHATSELAARALEQLAEHAEMFGLPKEATTEDLKTHALTLQLRDLMEHIEEAIKTDGEQQFSISPDELKICPRRVFISVPGMWTPPGNRCMTEAARKAGLDRVDLVFEPQAAAAYWLQKIKLSGGGMYKPGDRIQVLDVGGGTSDAIGYEVQPATNQVDCQQSDSTTSKREVASIKLVSMGDATGRLCGSEFINQAFLRWLPKYINQEYLKGRWSGGLPALRQTLGLTKDELRRHMETDFSELQHSAAKQVRKMYRQGVPKLLQELNLTKAELMDRANREFGQLKVRLDELEFQDPTQKLVISGKTRGHDDELDGEDDDDSGVGKEAPERKVIIKRDTFLSFYEPVLQDNFELVRDLNKGKADIKSIVVIGGLRSSTYFMDRLKQEFPEVTIVGATNSSVGLPHPVARGALWAFSIAQPRDLSCNDSYGIAEDQELHGDEYEDAHQDLVDNSEGILRDLLRPDSEMAAHRWRAVVEPGLSATRAQKKSVWQRRVLEALEREIFMSIYWSASGRPKNSAIMKDAEGEDTVDGVEQYVCLEGAVPDLGALGFMLKYGDKQLAAMRRRQAQDEEDDGAFVEGADEDYGAQSVRKRSAKSVGASAKQSKPRRKFCRHCGQEIKNAPTPQATHCNSCTEKARYEVYTRVVIMACGANIRVRWEMLVNPEKSNEDYLYDEAGDEVDHEDDFEEGDLLVLHDDAIVQSNFNPNPIT